MMDRMRPETRAANFDAFDRDVASNGAYLYSTDMRLSCRLATQRQRDAIMAIGRFADRSIIDVGCGDGFNTVRLWDSGHPKAMVGIDPAANAIAAANAAKGERPIAFAVADAHQLPYDDNAFDLAVIQGVLHHDDDAGDIVREAFRVAPEILVLEPNGYNLALKVIEKASLYHRAHHEKSYAPALLDRWVQRSGGRIVARRYAGTVPIFCPDWFARAMKRVEPSVERLPIIKAAGCSLFLFVARRP